SNLFDSGIQPPIEPVVFKGQMLFFTRASVSFVRAVQAYFSSGAIAGKKLFPAFKLVKRLLIMLKPMYLRIFILVVLIVFGSLIPRDFQIFQSVKYIFYIPPLHPFPINVIYPQEYLGTIMFSQ